MLWRGALIVMLAFVGGATSAQPLPRDTLPTTSDHVYIGKLMFSEAEEALYLKRFHHLMDGGGNITADSYDVLDKIPGAAASKPLPEANDRSRTISATALSEATQYAASSNANAFIVWRKGKIEAEHYFGGNTRASPIVAMSLAKPVSSVAIGRAIALGKIKSLDEPVADFITEWRGDPQREKILVRHLLDMRSGLLPQAAAPDAGDILNRAYLHPHHDEIIIREYPVTDVPGKRYEYSNATADLVAIVIERATGRRYAEFVGKEIWQPLDAMGGTVWLDRTGGTAHSGCCMLVPAEDYLRLAMLILKDGVWQGKRLLPTGYVTAMKTPTAENPYYGLALWVAGRYVERRGAANPDRQAVGTLHHEPYLAADLVLFDGNANQVVYIVPSQDLIILRTGASPPRAVGNEWDNTVLPNLIIRGIEKEKGTSQPQPQP